MKRDLPPRPRLLVEELERRILYSADAATLLGLDGALPAAELRVHQPVAAPPAAEQATDAGQQAPAREIVFIDSRVPDAAQLADALMQQRGSEREFDIVVLDAGEDGVAQIGRILAGEHGLRAARAQGLAHRAVTHQHQARRRLGSIGENSAVFRQPT